MWLGTQFSAVKYLKYINKYINYIIFWLTPPYPLLGWCNLWTRYFKGNIWSFWLGIEFIRFQISIVWLMLLLWHSTWLNFQIPAQKLCIFTQIHEKRSISHPSIYPPPLRPTHPTSFDEHPPPSHQVQFVVTFTIHNAMHRHIKRICSENMLIWICFLVTS